MKRPTKAMLRAAGLFNEHLVAKDGPEPQVMIWYLGHEGRSWADPGWRVSRVGYKTDPGGPFPNQGDKVFYVFNRTQKLPQLAAAQAWAGERYGVTAWERSTYGSYHPAGTIAAAMRTKEVRA